MTDPSPFTDNACQPEFFELLNQRFEVSRVPGGLVRLSATCAITGTRDAILMSERAFNYLWRAATSEKPPSLFLQRYENHQQFLLNRVSPFGTDVSFKALPPGGNYLESFAFSRGIWLCEEVRALLDAIDQHIWLRSNHGTRRATLLVPSSVFGATWRQMDSNASTTGTLWIKAVSVVGYPGEPKETFRERLTATITLAEETNIRRMRVQRKSIGPERAPINEYVLTNAALSPEAYRQFLAGFLSGIALTSLRLKTIR